VSFGVGVLSADGFDLATVDVALRGTRFAGRVQHFELIGSTNSFALDAAQGGAEDGCVYVADAQTAGRGRGTHGWHSATGDGLYVSVLLRPKMAIADALWMSLATGLAAQTAIMATAGLKAEIRWPNDLLIGEKKCGGVLVETSVATADRGTAAVLRFAVIGVGINVNHESFAGELEAIATSLRRESGRVYERERLLVEFLLALDAEMELLREELSGAHNGAGLLERFAVASTWVRGKRVRVDEAGGYTGVTDGLDARGFLRVAGDDGVLRTVLSGGVRAD
jgi:BirA family transcriptional regulator, biotin operon repressor / biotin---[acetyl-CoA-carboxylase] ligase